MTKFNIIRRETTRRLWERFLKTVHRRPIITFFALALSILAVASMILYEVEGNNGHPVWRTIVYLTSGVDVDPPETSIGELTVSLVVICGIILISVLTGYIASEFSRLLLSTSNVPRKSERQIFENHVIIFGWNPKTKAILRELDAGSHQRAFGAEQIVIVSEAETLTRGSENIYANVWHVHGSSTDQDVLRRADLAPSAESAGARVAVILGDALLPAEEADRMSLLTLLAVEHLYPGVISLVDAYCDESTPHFQNADADEVVVPNQYATLLLARAAEFPGLSSYIDELLALAPLRKDPLAGVSERAPVSFYVRSAGTLKLSGLTFSEAVEKLYVSSNALATGLLNENGVQLFPDLESSSRQLQDSDQIVLIATPQQVAI